MGAYLGLASGKGEKTNMKNMKKSITEFLCKVVGSSRGLAEAETIPSNIVSSLCCILTLATILFLQVGGGSLPMWSSDFGKEPVQMLSSVLQPGS